MPRYPRPPSHAATTARAAQTAAALLLSITVLAIATPAEARSDRSAGASLVNHERAQAGLRLLRPDGFLRDYAQGWADEMAAGQFVAHNPHLGEIWDGRTLLGENIGWGRSIEQIVGGFVSSPSHYANLVEPGYSKIGVGVAYGPDGSRYVAMLFQS